MKQLLIPLIALAVTSCGYGSQIEAKYACIDWQDAADNRACEHDPESKQWLGWRTAYTYTYVAIEQRFKY